MRLRVRIHEWLADHVKWIQYPGVEIYRPKPKRPPLSGKERAWLITGAFWLFLILLSIYGNSIP